MPPLPLLPPTWEALPGGNEEANWLASRDGKFGLSMALAREALEIEQQLREHDALLSCTPDVLRAVPGAAGWYFALLHLSNKMIDHSTERAKSHGLTRSPASVQRALRAGRPIEQEQLEVFSRWINAEIEHLFPQDDQEAAKREALASASALMALGARADGQNRNRSGGLGVTIVKTSLVEAMAGRQTIEVELVGEWLDYSPEHDLPGCRRIRFGHRLTCDFTPGGDRPDITIRFDDDIVAVGEIKSRIDLSNVWKSWMPQVVDHLRAWAREYPPAARLLFGTVITEGMVRGESLKGTRHVGLRELHEEGALTSAYNLANLVAREPTALRHFADLVAALESLLSS
jgi:hypothetical protein